MAKVTTKPERPLIKAEQAKMMEHLTPASMRWCRNRSIGGLPETDAGEGVKRNRNSGSSALRLLVKPPSTRDHWRQQEPFTHSTDSMRNDLQEIEDKSCVSLLLIREDFLARITRILLAPYGALTTSVKVGSNSGPCCFSAMEKLGEIYREVAPFHRRQP